MTSKVAAPTRLLSRYAASASTVRCTVNPRPLRWLSTSTRQWSTPLAKNLAEAITTTGPIPISSYMRQCLTSPDGGYYSSRDIAGKDQFGKSGDFITSPEISQIFGELVGIFFVAEWISQGRKSGIELIELGPGRGTLMDDALRTIRNFRPMSSSIDTIYLVEASETLRETQKALLCGDVPMEEIDIGYQSMTKHLPSTRVVWIEDINFKPRDNTKTPFVIAHEFFDALPIHAFQSAEQAQPALEPKKAEAITTSTNAQRAKTEWRELLVSPTAPPSVIKPPPSPPPEFELTLSPKPTQHSRLLPYLSKRYQDLLSTPGSTIEICPAARTTMTYLAELIGHHSTTLKGQRPPSNPPEVQMLAAPPSGAALIVDYGPSDTVPVSTLRGIRGHKTCSPFESAGQVDLSADVDFGALVETALDSSEQVEVHGPVEQGDWMRLMGGRERCDALISQAKSSEAKDAQQIVERIETAWNRLVSKGPNGMGKLYKAMAVIPVTEGRRRPVGFGGDLQS